MAKIVLTGGPADAAAVALINEELKRQGKPPWSPGVDYTIVPCDKCGSGVWIGPRQKAVRDAEDATNATVLCIPHAHEYAMTEGVDSYGHLGGGTGPKRT